MFRTNEEKEEEEEGTISTRIRKKEDKEIVFKNKTLLFQLRRDIYSRSDEYHEIFLERERERGALSVERELIYVLTLILNYYYYGEREK